MLNNLKIYSLIFIAGVSLGLIASVMFIRPSKRDIQRQLDWRDSTVRLNTELEYSRLQREAIISKVDSLMRLDSINRLRIDSIQKERINIRKNADNEIKGVRYWNDAKRDSFWRVEGARW